MRNERKQDIDPFEVVASEKEKEPEQYWEKHLKRHNIYEMDLIQKYYPKERIITVDASQIINNEVWEETLLNPRGQEEYIVPVIKRLYPFTERPNKKLIVRYHHVSQKRKIKELRQEDEIKLISIKALVKRVSEIRPKIVRATFQCAAGHQHEVTPNADIILPPHACGIGGCELRTFDHVEVRDIKIDRQWMYIQDPLEDLTDGGQPSFLKCELLEDLCGKVMAGDRVIANGQYRSFPIRKGGVLTTSKDVYFDISSLEVDEREFEEVKLTDDDEMKIIELSKSDGLFDKLTESVAPSILGMKLLKQAIVLQLFEGVTRKLKDGVVNRGHINVLCVSDPGMAKTKLLRFVASIAPRGVFTNATTSTKVGLVAPIVRDETTGEYTVQAGAYMIASGGILCLDEVSELDKSDFKYLNEAMEDGEAHITKGGLNITVKTRASLLAACNPIEGSFDSYQPLAEQVKIPESTLSRFDLKILLQDISEEGKDRKMIEHITASHMDEPENLHISPEMLRKYIAYGRKLKPKLTSKSKKVIDDYYVSIRKECGNDKMKVTPRQGTAVIRLSEAHARMRLSSEVTTDDAEVAVKLFDMCFRNVATDPETGKIDISRIDHKHKFGLVDIILKTIKNGTDGKASEGEILMETSKYKYESEKVCRTIRELCNEGKVMQPKNGIYKVL